MRKKHLCVTALTFLLAFSVMGCGKKEEEPVVHPEPIVEESTETETETVETEENHDGMYQSELTGEWIDESLKDQRPMAIMVDNESTALPHYGLSDADIVYEMMNSTANGRITRLMVLVKDWEKIDMLGSIRSVRPTNVLLAADWNAILLHDGGPFYNDPYFAEGYTDHFSGGFWREKNGKAQEFTEYVTTEKDDNSHMTIEEQFAQYPNVTKEYNSYYKGQHLTFASEDLDLSSNSEAIDATDIKLPFSHTKSELKYNEKTGTYDHYVYGKEHVDAGNNNEVLTFKNVILQNCTFHQYDENGYMIYNCIDPGSDGYYITNGKAVPITWVKGGETEPTRFYDESGKEIEINVGKTYISLIPDDTWDDVKMN
ncbi:MAG: DUF3048 domain-containing protein [Lachnospiraceae bacterium]|nr:DUF3048 domain-containing protein [Lachnospiraceae bacterium]